MPDPAQKQLPSIDKVAEAALAHVRKICKWNGIKADAVTIAASDIRTLTMNAGTYLELKPALTERSVPGKVAVAKLAASKEDALRQMDQVMINAARNPAQKAQIADALLRRPDKGFGLPRQPVVLDFLKSEFAWQDACPACQGKGQAACPRCNGRRTEACTKCSGRGLMPCPTCRASGMVQGARCPRCSAQRYVPCDQCRRSGYMSCRNCNGGGITKCATCNGAGAKTTVLTMQAAAIPYFEYDAKSVPAAAADMIETGAQALATSGAIDIKGRTADEKENVLGANYEVGFPFGDITFSIGKKEAKAKLFGYNADLINFPPILDQAVKQSLSDLEKAARDIGSVATAIRQASRYRVIALAYANAPRLGPSKTIALLLKQYDIGLTRPTAEKITALAGATTGLITKKPRLYGLAAGIGVGIALTAAYYLALVRAPIAAMLPDARLDAVLDIPVPLLIGTLATLCIRYSAGHALEKALGAIQAHGKKAEKKKPDLPMAGPLARIGWGAGIVLPLVMMEIAVHLGKAAPHWYTAARNLIAGP